MVYTNSIDGSEWIVSIAGVKDVQVKDVDELLEEVRNVSSTHLFQLFDARKVAGRKHLCYAAINAVKAFQTYSAISKSLDIEVLLYAACLDQISKAFRKMGISSKSTDIAILCLGKSPKTNLSIVNNMIKVLGDPDGSVLEVNQSKYELLKEVFEISQQAIETVGGDRYEALTKLIIEKGALLSFHR
jgi:tRNA threonylcarbamoyladenosine modification (KEOPS) complex Cgi121 subunit